MKTRNEKKTGVIILMIAAIAIAFAFTACGGDDDNGDKVYVYTPGEIVGTGTSDDPFHVHDVITLSSVGKTPEDYDNWTLTAHYKQVANIDLNTVTNWTSIGTYSNTSDDLDDPFTGTYDGGGYTINNLTINTTERYQSLFGYIETDGVVKNVGLIDCNISSGGIVGGLVCINSGTVSNCYTTGNVVSTNGYAGGIVGSNGAGTISNCYSTADVSGAVIVGGVSGWNTGTVSDCYSTGKVSGRTFVGGVVGDNHIYSDNATVSNCVALNSSITRTSDTATTFGRVVGANYNGGTSTNSYARSTMEFIDEEGDSSTTFPYNVTYPSDNGTDITSAQWSSSTWWTGTAGWDASIWDFSNISATNLPTLRNVGGTQSPTVK